MLAKVLLLAVFIIFAGSAVADEAKFPISSSPLQLEGVPISHQYFDVTGRRAILMGCEGRDMEVWIYPFKVAHNIRLSFDRKDFPEPLASETLARWIVVRPESTSIVFSHEEFRVTMTSFVPLDEAAAVILLDVDSHKPLTVSLSFVPDLEPMWPASLGGQYAFWNDDLKAFVLSESRRIYNALIGSPAAVRHFSTPAHRLSETPNRFEIDVSPEEAARGYIPIVFAGGSMKRKAATELYQKIIANVGRLYTKRREHALRIHREMLSIDSPDDRFDLAFEWGKVALDDGVVCNPDLGCGWVAGFGMSGRSERPGFAWYFGGDTFFNSFAVRGYGDFDSVRQALEFIRRNQREDGKIMHELSQGAAFIRWFEDYPYGYYHLETSAYYIVCLWQYVLAAGDMDFLKESWPSMVKAFRYSRTTETDGDGLIENSKGGLGALEVGVLLEDLKTDIYVAGLWIEAMRCMERAAELLEDEEVLEEVRPLRKKSEKSLQRLFFNEDLGFHALAISVDGSAVSELTAWPAVPMMFGLMPEEEAKLTLKKLAGPEIATDWGIRMLTNESSVYDPIAYNNGAVWPFLTGYVAMAQYRYGRPAAGWQLVQGLRNLTFENSRGDIAELYSGDFRRPLTAAVPHQLFSTGGFIAPVTRGMLGIHPDAVKKTFTFAPQIPLEWDFLTVNNVRLGKDKVAIQFERDGSKCRFHFKGAVRDWSLDFRPSFPLGTKIETVRVGGRAVDFSTYDLGSVTVMQCELPFQDNSYLEIVVDWADSVVLLSPKSLPGQRSQGLRYIDSWSDGETSYYVVAGRRGRSYQCSLWISRGAVPVKIEMPSSGNEFPRVTLVIRNGKIIEMR